MVELSHGLFRSSLSVSMQIQDCLTDPDPGHFTFVPTHFFWKSRSLDLEALQISRTQSVLGFGTCSVVEPVDALVQLGLMAPEE